MKKVILFFAIAFCAIAFAQIKIDNSPNSITIGKITAGSITLSKKNDTELGDVYSICYNDAKFTKIDSFKCFGFIETGNDLDKFYNVIMEGFDSSPKENIKLDFPLDKIELNFEKMMGIVSMRFNQFNKRTGIYSYSGFVTKKQIDKLFNKNNK